MDSVSRDYPDRPLIGVSALVRRDGKVLLVRRDRPPFAGKWSLPGGLVEAGERLEDAVVREVREETGLVVARPRRIDVEEAIDRDESGRTAGHYVLVVFAADDPAGAIHAGDDAAEARWVDAAEAGRLPLTEGTARVLAKGEAGR
jgi:ADP-ribose pyrophosphatase YjhB (NUDIX family)